MTEEWRDIPNFVGIYQVSNTGRVRSIDRTVRHMGPHNKDENFKYKGKIRKKSVNRYGYETVLLSHPDGRKKLKRVHRLVAECFLEKHNSVNVVNHIDGNKLNNNVENLEWCSVKENNLHARDVLKRGCLYNNGRAKKIRCKETGDIFESAKDAALWCGAKRSSNIRGVANGYYGRNTCCGYHWEWV